MLFRKRMNDNQKNGDLRDDARLLFDSTLNIRAERRTLIASVFLAITILNLGVSLNVRAGVDMGEIHFAEMNCVACHSTSPTIVERLASRKSPVLGSKGSQLSPTWVRDFLLDPQKEKPGSLMPDMLHGLSASKRNEVAEALTHYLFSLQGESTNSGTRLDLDVMKEGGTLFHRVGCVACHAPQELPAVSTVDYSGDAPKDAPSKSVLTELATNSVPMGNLAKKYSVETLAVFLRDPLKTRPSGRMPNQKLNEKEARAIAMYLLRDQPSPVSIDKIQGLNYEHFEKVGKELPDFSKHKVSSTGYATSLSLEGLPHRNSTALRFRGVLSVPRDGDYTFWTLSRDGSQLFIDGKIIVDNDGVHKPTEKEGKIKLSAGDHKIAVTYFHHNGPPVLKASWSGPGIEKQEIPKGSISLADNGRFMRIAGEQPFVLDNAKVEKGRALFDKHNCASCHDLNQPKHLAMPLEKLSGKAKGCLAAVTSANVPRFTLTEKQRGELVSFLSKTSTLQQPLSAADQAHRTMTALNCYACHNRDGQGGPSGSRRAYFKVNGEADLGEEGAVPPHLNGVGAKLKPAWLEKVLTNSASVRPYMATRMPQFGEANVKGLSAALLQADESQKVGAELVVHSGYVDGLRLVGSEGLSCIACHNFAGKPSLGIPALDITTSPERLNSAWFRRYLLDPQKLRPGTRMPPFWPAGVAANQTILDGNTEKQIAAIWSYLSSDKVKNNLPPGLVAPKMELAPKTEPLIYRNFIEGAGSRAIGVGYPEKVNFAFDANQMRLALVWHGQFMDASRHWTGRGNGWEPPMGYSVLKFPEGAPFALVDSPGTLWPKSKDRVSGYQFKGYRYDDKRNPQFLYMYGKIEVSEKFEPTKIGVKSDTGLRRRLTLTAKTSVKDVWFRAAVADNVIELSHATYLVDGGLRLSFPSVRPRTDSFFGPQIIVRTTEGKKELLVPVDLTQPGTAEIVEEISW